MKKKTLALLGAVAFAGVALASCNGKKGGGGNNNGDDSGSTLDKAVWDPISLAEAQSAYTVSGDLDLWLCYSKNYGTTYNNVITDTTKTTNPIDNINYSAGDQLPVWKAFTTKLGLQHINQGAAYGDKLDDKKNYENFTAAKDDQGKYRDKNNNVVDLFYNTTTNLNSLGDDDQLVDLTSYIDDGKMPALKKFLDDNGAVKAEITHNGAIYYTPYLDGYQAIERNYMMDTEQVEKLLDRALPTGTGAIVAGAAATNEKGLVGEAKATPFMNADYNYAEDTEIDILDIKAETTKSVTVTVHKTTNIIKQQNELLNTTDGSCTGAALITQFKNYARAAYGDIIDNYYDGSISKMFTSGAACYNADDMVALLRIFKANPDVLYGSADAYDAVVPMFPRGQANNRVENILNFGATLYGVQGRGSEYDHLFFGADKKIHDFDTQQASYDMLDRLHDLYSEKLIQQDFWSGSKGTAGLDSFFTKKIKDSSTYGLIEYDYIATQSAANDLYQGVGTNKENRQNNAASGVSFANTSVQGVKAILSPLTYVSTESYTYSQHLDDFTGKTLQRYYEENRAVKNTSWAIPVSSDNIDSAVALMDIMFTKEGWEIQNFGPEGYWNYGQIMGVDSPIIKQEVLTHFSDTGIDFWNYCRGFIGSTQGVGHYRPVSLDFQATNYYTRDSYTNLIKACEAGVQMNSRSVGKKDDITWHASMVMAIFSAMDKTVSNQYAGVTNFWSQADKVNTTGTKYGWVMIVAEGKDTTKDVLGAIEGAPRTSYKYQDVLNERSTKNTTYLYTMGNKMSMIAPEAQAAN